MSGRNERDVKEEIAQLIAEQDFKNAGRRIVEHNLQQEYGIETVLIPLYLQQRHELLMDYIRDQPAIQLQYTRFLDACLGANCQLLEIARHIGPANVYHPQIEHLNIKKHLSKVLNKFGFYISSCPNLLFSRKISALNFFINKKYRECTITEESYKEMIEMIADSCADIPLILVRQIAKKKDLEAALLWAEQYHIPSHQWPYALKEYNWSKRHQAPYSMPLQHTEFLQLRLNRANLILVETPRQLINALELLQQSSIIGIDEEWQPSLGITDGDPPLALMQLATRTRVFILDVMKLKPILRDSHWQRLANLFHNPNILKLAYHFENGDLAQLERCSPVMASLGKLKSVLDLKDFFEQLQQHYPELAEEQASNPDQVGLSRLTMAVLGLPLDKREQKSNWEKRPLRTSLLNYAALDAHCLIQVYDALQQRAQSHGRDFSRIVDLSLSGTLKSSAPVPGYGDYED